MPNKFEMEGSDVLFESSGGVVTCAGEFEYKTCSGAYSVVPGLCGPAGMVVGLNFCWG